MPTIKDISLFARVVDNKKPKIKQGLREIKKGFLKDVDLEPSIKVEISKDFNINKKNKY